MRLEILNNASIEEYDDIFKAKLEDALYVFLDKVYPFDKTVHEIPARYKNWQVRCAIELYNLDQDGDYASYSENGLAWTKLSQGLSPNLLRELPPPQAGVPV